MVVIDLVAKELHMKPDDSSDRDKRKVDEFDEGAIGKIMRISARLAKDKRSLFLWGKDI